MPFDDPPRGTGSHGSAPGEVNSSPELILELKRVRAAAEAKRLESRAAEIELLLRRAVQLRPDPATRATDRLPVRSWQELLESAALPAEPLPAASAHSHRPAAAKRSVAAEPPPRPRRLPSDESRPRSPTQPAFKSPTSKSPTPRGPAGIERRRLANRSPAANEVSDPARRPRRLRRSRRSAAWLASMAVHGGLLVLLAGMTISIADPPDQIRLDASPPQPSEAVLETVALESVEQPNDSTPAEAEPQLATASPLGLLEAAEITVAEQDVISPPSDAFRSLAAISAAANLPQLEATGTASQFFGAEAGGNHFVYLVDNSGSMTSIARDGFDAARRELLRSIDALAEHQRFYVMFFGEEVLRMRIADPAVPERRSVYATAENKAALRRWAMGVSTQSGRWPEKALEFAFELRPDVIFLLTDGEMSQRVEPMIRQHNTVESLFDPPHPRSIIHTIGFYSQDGAEQLRQIAEVNGGTYQFVPPPKR